MVVVVQRHHVTYITLQSIAFCTTEKDFKTGPYKIIKSWPVFLVQGPKFELRLESYLLNLIKCIFRLHFDGCYISYPSCFKYLLPAQKVKSAQNLSSSKNEEEKYNQIGF